MSALRGILTLNKLLTDLQSVSRDIASTALVERGAGWIRLLESEFPFAYNLLMSALYKEPGDVLEALIKINGDLAQLRGNENVLNYIAQLQAKLRRPHDRKGIDR
jgi:hypothetical protein